MPTCRTASHFSWNPFILHSCVPPLSASTDPLLSLSMLCYFPHLQLLHHPSINPPVSSTPPLSMSFHCMLVLSLTANTLFPLKDISRGSYTEDEHRCRCYCTQWTHQRLKLPRLIQWLETQTQCCVQSLFYVCRAFFPSLSFGSFNFITVKSPGRCFSTTSKQINLKKYTDLQQC